MAGSDENKPSRINDFNVQGGLQARSGEVMPPIGHNRRALKDINPNNVGDPRHPCLVINKRTTLEHRKDDESEKNPEIPGHQPVKRKFDAEMANIQQYVKEEIKKPIVVCEASPSEDDADVHKNNDDAIATIPIMSVEHSEAMLEETDQMDEVEMDNIDEPIVDIDEGNRDNPLAVTEYIDDIYAYYKETEGANRVPSDYMKRQTEINEKMRSMLIDWLIEVHEQFELAEETLYLTVNLIDRFLALRVVIREKLQLVGVTAMLLASKYDEKKSTLATVNDLVLICDKAYSRQEVLEMERQMINSLQFNMSMPTPYVFMKRFLQAAQADEELKFMAFFLIELSLIEHEMLRFLPSQLAAAAVFSALCTQSGFKHWSRTCEWHTGYSQEQLMECSKLMVTLHQKAAIGKLTAVFRKYSTSKYGYAAFSYPANFLLDANGINN